MAAITNVTNAAAFDKTSLADSVSALIRFAVNTPYIWRGIAEPVSLLGTDTWRQPIHDSIAAAPAYSTESDEVAAVELSPDGTDITTAEYATAVFLSDKAATLSMHPALQIAVESVLASAMKRIDTQVLSLATSMSNSQGSNATVNTAENLSYVSTAFLAQGKMNSYMPVCVMHPDAVRDLSADLALTGAALYGSSVGESLHAALSGVSQGLFREWNNMIIAVSDRVPAGDTTGWSNFMVHFGPGESALAVPFSREIRVRVDERPERVGSWVVADVMMGAGIMEQARAYKFITRT